MATRRLLTKKRERWVQSRDVTLRGSPLRNNIVNENHYADQLERLALQMIEETQREVMRLFASPEAVAFYAQDASLASQARMLMNRLERNFDKLFARRSKALADAMVNRSKKASKSALHSSLKQLSGGLSIKTDILTGQLNDIVTATVAENVGLIKTIPETYFANVRGAVMRSITQPDQGGLAELTKSIDSMLDMRAKQIRNKARNVALDQSRKAYNNINKGRMEAVGIEEFIWVHSGGGQKPRSLHQNILNGKTFRFDDLPIIDQRTGERGIPGQAINCRCVMTPVIPFGNNNNNN